jgi:2-polyprenyl-3-methyl-5-hydroxy-6-metoxy-1,4-benzoquinol methylase
MANVPDHYSQLLARHYVWMTGMPFDAKVAEQKDIIRGALGSAANGLAIDYGCGPGFQAIALAEMGFAPVIAVDSSSELLDELKARKGGWDITLEQADITEFETGHKAVVALCMGDTLTHLDSKDRVRAFFKHVAAQLVDGGAFVITYRDLSVALNDVDRFIPVRSDSEKIMTCFLEYVTTDTVRVTDLIYTREPTHWSLEKSSYEKLRLSVKWVAQALSDAGFVSVTTGMAGRLNLVTARTA